MRAPFPLLAALVMVVHPAPAPAAGTPDERAAAYREFREAFDKGNYREALPAANRVVEMTRSQFEEDAPENANALTNLATTYYRMKAYGEALDNYRKAITVLELQSDATDPRMVRPLHGLGNALLALHREEEAVAPLKRAVDIVRNRDGLHAEAQLPVLRSLIEAYAATGRTAEAGREQEYAFSVAEGAYGKNDLRLVGPIEDLARWYEQTRRFTTARLMHMRAVQTVDAVKKGGVEAVPALRGIARCFRLAFIYGETGDSAEAAQAPMDAPTGTMIAAINQPTSDGERALLDALSRLGGDTRQAAQRGAVLVDLGDWYRMARKDSRAFERWADAWKELAAAGDTSLLAQPAAISYAPPAVAASERQRDSGEYNVEQVQIRVAIDAKGNVRDATVANPSPPREAAEKAVVAALRSSAWRPAFREGKPVAVDDFTFRESVYVKLPKSGG
jgi:tetratricopeptide (TPR) repeat protein